MFNYDIKKLRSSCQRKRERNNLPFNINGQTT